MMVIGGARGDAVSYMYEGTGSGAGVSRLLDDESDFAGSDAELGLV